MDILFEDDFILVCKKPAGVATQAAKISEKDMVSEVNNYLYKRAGHTCPAFLIHRLDKPVAGILVFAKTKDMAAKLNGQLSLGKMSKKYYCVVNGICSGENILLTDYLTKDSKQSKAVISTEKAKDAKKAELIYSVVPYKKITESDFLKDFIPDNFDNSTYSLLDIKLLTGRFHQIRAQLSGAGFPILGDVKYGGEEIATKNKIFLIAYELSFVHPKSGKNMTFSLEMTK